ncbi:MAG: ATPase, partial [Verrucomicrobia bacterium]|nr:ATPase [Verrucomicrobiota bacterium]
GKSRLAEEYAKTFPKALILSGIPPEDGVTAKDQRIEFLRQLQEYRLPIYKSDDWGDLFYELANVCKEGPVLIILDEITWMGSQDRTFLPKLKTAWDRHFKKNPNLVLILSGSNSSWINKNILSSTGFFGRISLRIMLDELSLSECNAFWQDWPGMISSYEKFKILSVTGGVPRYLEELRPDLTAEKNLYRLCFTSEGLLFNEFDQIFHDLFSKKGPFYKQIVTHLVNQNLNLSDLAQAIERPTGGDLSDAMDELVQSGFLSRDYCWSLEEKKRLGSSRYRVKDNYLRFYLKYILPYKEQIETGQLERLPPGWHSIMGLQFENLVVTNGPALRKCLDISPDEVVFANPYLQTPRSRRAGCQIDYLVQTRFSCLYVFEVKFRQEPLGREVIDEMQQKLSVLKLPHGFSVRPILIHVNGVDESVRDSGFFARIIDFSELFAI